MIDAMSPVLSVVVPMRNEARSIGPLMSRLGRVLDAVGEPAEVIAIDDGSTDGTTEILKEARAAEPRLKIVSFSRNFGKEVALAAGLRYARGRAVVLMDGDLQHPPELIEEFVRRWRAGWQVAYAARTDRRNEGRRRRVAARLFYAAFAKLSSTDLPRGGGDFRLLDRRVVDALNMLPERTRFTKGLYAWIGFRQTSVPYHVAERQAGRSGWSFRALWRFALDGIVSFSTLPLRVWTYMGLLISVAAIGYALSVLVGTLIWGVDVPGYPSLIVAIMFFAGVQLISLGIIGEYIGRIFTEVKRRPLYIVAEEVGFAPAPGYPVGGEVLPTFVPAAREASGDGRRSAAMHHGA